METFLLAFISLFVAIDVLGVLPLFVSLTENLTVKRRKKLTLEATLFAFIFSVVVLATGKLLFSALRKTTSESAAELFCLCLL